MNPAEVVTTLAYFQQAWPWVTLGDHTAEVWAEALWPVHPDHGLNAMKRLVKSEERPPSIARFLAECRKVERDGRPALTAGPEKTDRAGAARVARILAAAVAKAAESVPDHRNHDRSGGDNCPACSTRLDREHITWEIRDQIRSAIDGAAGGGA